MACATYSHFKTPSSMISSYKWVITHCCGVKKKHPISHKEIMKLAATAKNPFLFIVHALRFQRLYRSRLFVNVADIPISMDASSSAYQIISFFLLDQDLAQRTNFIGGGDGDTIHDLYSSLIEPLSSYLKENLEKPLGELVASSLTRKLIKKVFMPMVYGKTLLSSANDIRTDMSAILKRNEHMKVAGAFYKFFDSR
jgi:DNA-directed RNA polymerase